MFPSCFLGWCHFSGVNLTSTCQTNASLLLGSSSTKDLKSWDNLKKTYCQCKWLPREMVVILKSSQIHADSDFMILFSCTQGNFFHVLQNPEGVCKDIMNKIHQTLRHPSDLVSQLFSAVYVCANDCRLKSLTFP